MTQEAGRLKAIHATAKAAADKAVGVKSLYESERRARLDCLNNDMEESGERPETAATKSAKKVYPEFFRKESAPIMNKHKWARTNF